MSWQNIFSRLRLFRAARPRHAGKIGTHGFHGESAHHKKKRRRGLFHGEPDLAFDAGDIGDGSSYEPNYGAADMASTVQGHDPEFPSTFVNSYGAGDTGQEFEPTLEDGGIDPFANAVFDDPTETLRDEDFGARLAPTGFDVFDPAEQIPTLRNPVVDFGLDDTFYSGVGPAAIIGCEYGGSRVKG